MRPVLFFILLSLFFSCQNSVTTKEDIDTEIRLKFIEGKTNAELKSDYRELGFDDKKALWTNKMYQSLNELPKEFEKDFLLIINQINKATTIEGLTSDILIDKSIELSTKIPTDDFKMIFFSLEDYKYNGFVGSIDEDFISEYESYSTSENQERQRIITARRDLPDCDCKWTCEVGSLCSHKSCNETERGCGFLWLQRCKSYAENLLQNCG